jgi:hypothetical protein
MKQKSKSTSGSAPRRSTDKQPQRTETTCFVNERPMADSDWLGLAFHVVGNMACFYWAGESLVGRSISLLPDGRGLFETIPCPLDEKMLMAMIAGCLAEELSEGIVPTQAIRYSPSYCDPGSFSSRIRTLIRILLGKDDQNYQFQLQERVRAVFQTDIMWQGMTAIAAQLLRQREMSGEECQAVFERLGVPNALSESSPYPMLPPIAIFTRQPKSRAGHGVVVPEAPITNTAHHPIS